MKLVLLLTTVACLQCWSETKAQTVTLFEKNASLENLFSEIRKQTGYHFIYTKEDLQNAKPVSIDVKDADVDDVLEICFRDQPLSYTVVEKQVVVKKKKEVVSPSNFNSLSLIDVKGRVVNEKGEPVEGVTVKVKGTSMGTSSDAEGYFFLKNVDERAKLEFSGVNVELYEADVNGNKNLLVSLKMKVTSMEDVSVQVNTGYQKVAIQRVTGSYDQISNQLYNQQAGSNVLKRLEPIANGLTVSRKINSNGQILIRGLSTINGPKDPLIVLDNFPYEGDINNINPNDIESATILKDAAASSIWGVRAGNGVIVLTTKKGRFNQPFRIEVNASTTVSKKPDLFYLKNISSPDFINVEQFLFDKGFYSSTEMNSFNRPPLSPVVEWLIAKRDGMVSSQEASQQIEALVNRDVRNDFNKYFYRNAVNQQYDINARGGSNQFCWILSAGFDKDINSLSANNERYNIRTDNTLRVTKNLDLSLGLYFTQTDNRGGKPGYSDISTSTGILPPYTMFADANGDALPFYKEYRKTFLDTIGGGRLLDWKYYPIEDYKYVHNKTSTEDILITTGLQWKLWPFLNFDFKYQFENQKSNNSLLYDENSFYARNLINTFTQIDYTNNKPAYAIPKGAILDLNAGALQSHSARGQLSFTRSFKKHEITALAGGDVRQITTNSNSYRTYGYDPATLVFTDVDYTNTYPMLVPAYSAYIPELKDFERMNNRFVSAFANLSYTYDKKYIVTASSRRDGSNLFGVSTNHKWNPLWSAGIGWNIFNESFYKSRKIPYLKLRASYGFSGNVNQQLSAVTSIQYLNNSNYTLTPQARFIQFANPELRPEKIATLNAGIDLRTLKDRFGGSIDYYRKKGNDLYGDAPIDYTSGLGRPTITKNVASMRSRGLDVKLNSVNTIKPVQWTTELNFNLYKDEITYYYLSSLQGNNFINNGEGVAGIKGKPVYSVFSYKWAGLDPLTGDPMGFFNKQVSKDYAKLVKDSIQNLVYNGPALPTVYGTIGNTFSWKNLSLTVRMSFEFGDYFQRSSISYSALFNQSIGHPDFSLRWQNPGDEKNTYVPSMIYPANANRDAFYDKSEVLVEKGDNIRLQYINLNYSFLKHSSRFQNANLYLVLNNACILWRANKQNIDPAYGDDIIPEPTNVSMGFRCSF